MRNSPIFIVGCGRSGTTLLGSILNAHPNICIFHETFLLPFYYNFINNKSIHKHYPKWLNILQQRSEFNAKFVDKLCCSMDDNIDNITNMFMAAAEKKGAKRWGEKAPRYIYNVPQILAMFPQAKIIHIIRDGRDVNNSMLKKFDDAKNIYCAALKWRIAVKEGNRLKEILSAENYYEIKYEDLLSSLEVEVRKLLQFLDEDFSAQCLEHHKNFSYELSDPHAQHFSNVKRQLIKNNFNKWKEELSVSQIKTIEKMNGQLLDRLGYPTLHKKDRLPLYKGAWYVGLDFCSYLYWVATQGKNFYFLKSYLLRILPIYMSALFNYNLERNHKFFRWKNKMELLFLYHVNPQHSE